MQCNGNFKQWFNIFLIISEAWQGYESKAYGVSNHNLKLQSKKLSRTRDIPNFPTQGWADTAFCTRKRSETYIYIYAQIVHCIFYHHKVFIIMLISHYDYSKFPLWRLLIPLNQQWRYSKIWPLKRCLTETYIVICSMWFFDKKKDTVCKYFIEYIIKQWTKTIQNNLIMITLYIY